MGDRLYIVVWSYIVLMNVAGMLHRFDYVIVFTLFAIVSFMVDIYMMRHERKLQ